MEEDGGGSKVGLLESFMKNQQNSLKSLFHRKKSSAGDASPSPIASPKPIPQLSLLANSVVSRCSNILKIPTEDLQHRFDVELPESVKQLLTYARNFLEFCSFQALHQVMKQPNYLSDQEFRQLMFDMMLAWETPSVTSEHENKDAASPSKQDSEDEDGWSLFYSSPTNMAMQVNEKKSVGQEAFARIAPVCPAIADAITVHNLFDALTSASGHRLHFLVYDKYIRTLDKIFKSAKSSLGPSAASLQLTKGEIVLDMDGANPVLPVLKHVGISAWPGKLTLTSCALYFDSMGGSDKPMRYDLTEDTKQVIKPDLTGPLGARIFDKAIMYKSIIVPEPVYFEFTEFKGNARRDYWLGICLEILRVQWFIRKYNFKGVQRSEILARAILGIFRYRAIKEAFQVFSSQYKTLLIFNLAESLPGGDMVLEALYSRVSRITTDVISDVSCVQYMKWPSSLSPVSLILLEHFGLNLESGTNMGEEMTIVGDFCVGETSPLEIALKQSILDTDKAEAAQATVKQVKVEGIDTNVAVMKELLLPFIKLGLRIELLASWEDPYKSIVFMILVSYLIISGWIGFILPSILLIVAIVMLWRKQFNKGKEPKAVRVKAPPSKNAVEQLLVLQDAISQFESLIQAVNVGLLKIRAITLAILPQATDTSAISLVIVAVILAVVPVKYLITIAFVEWFTREVGWRKASSDRLERRIREWWFRVPAAPVQLIRADESKKKK
ncbi:hypothetical protein EUTSA_v10003718mg [Eutrema salsugineum]|uniref:DUF639 domain-containing protein n=1 Tax=Eutrema salsugineum TaxID=72664 RepID=V4MKE3_EUTSA|nr:uncharacterized protein LOC18012673 [Eutrema salsugineum]ESQ31891.1 hypothetical protein EUTSA_v10003718mg [Eutrema salsugineum]